jgi:hypothetical protein
MFAVGRQLRAGVLQDSDVESGNLLSKIWTLGRELLTLPEHMVRQLLLIR